MSFLGFFRVYLIFSTNLAFPKFYKITCTNIDLSANFLETSGFSENLADFLYVGIVKFKVVLNLVTNFVYP